MNPLNTIKGTIDRRSRPRDRHRVVAGFATDGISFNVQSFIMWLHVLAGITWIGLLYYFNFVQMPALAAAAKDQGGPGGAGISKYVAPRALLWFRWAAVATWLTGVAYLGALGLFVRGVHAAPARASASASAPGSARSCCSTYGYSSGRTRRRCSASSKPRPTRSPKRAASHSSRRAPTRCCRSRC